MKFAMILILLFSFGLHIGFAHEEMSAPVVRVEKVFAAKKPLGNIHVVYAETEEPDKEPVLRLSCDLFKASVAAAELKGLPRSDWGAINVYFSMTSFDVATKKFIEKPYLNIMVPVLDPEVTNSLGTWVHYLFDAEGKFTGRMIKQFVPYKDINATKVIWEEWPVGTDVKKLLDSKKKE